MPFSYGWATQRAHVLALEIYRQTYFPQPGPQLLIGQESMKPIR